MADDSKPVSTDTRRAIRIRGARQNNLAQPRPRHPDRRAGRRDRRLGLGQELAGVRHAVRRRPAPLRRDLLAVRAAVPRPHGPARGGPHRGRAAGDRDRPDQPGAHLAQHGRHDDRAERSPEAAVRARRAALLPPVRAAGAARLGRVDPRQPRGARRAGRRPAPDGDVPGAGAEEFRRGRGARAPRGAGLHARCTASARRRDAKVLDVVSDRFRFAGTERSRVADALERALRLGGGRVDVHAQDDAASATTWRYSTDLHCADCDIHYETPHPSTFSFNSPLGACETCRGFGRVIGVDYGLVIPDERKTLREGAIKPFQIKSFIESQRDLEKSAAKDGIPLDVPFRELTAAQKEWVIGGGAGWKSWKKSWPGTWYGVKRFFEWLESKAYKMHIRVLLVALSLVHTVPGVRGQPAASRRHAVASRRAGGGARTRCRRRPLSPLPAGARRVDAAAARRPARPVAARPDAAADRARQGILRRDHPAAAARRGDRDAARRAARAAGVPRRCRPGLSDARPPEPDAFGRRGPAHQPDHRARHLTRQHAVRARRAVDRPASARHASRRSR